MINDSMARCLYFQVSCLYHDLIQRVRFFKKLLKYNVRTLKRDGLESNSRNV